jgi:hypothetical protein
MESVQIAAARVFTSQVFKRVVEMMSQRVAFRGNNQQTKGSNSGLRFWHRTAVVFPQVFLC